MLYNIYFSSMLLNLEVLLDKETIRSLIWVLVYSAKIIFVNFCNCTKFYHEVRLYISFTIRYELKYNA